MIRIVIGIAGLIIFMLPVFSGVLNTGNGVGIVFSALLLIWGLNRNKADVKLNEMFSCVAGRTAIIIFICLFLAGTILIATESVLMVKAAGNQPEGDTTLVVLGCKVNGTEPSQILEGRISAAERYLKKNPGTKAVLSGGQGSDEGISEAQCMYNCLTERGIDAGRLYIEDKSTSTEENIKFSSEIIKNYNLSEKITIVTNEFHLYRACFIAQKLGFKTYSIPSLTPLVFIMTYILREYFAIPVQWIK